MAHDLHRLSYNFWLWNSLGPNGLELQRNISKIKILLYYYIISQYSSSYGQDIQRLAEKEQIQNELEYFYKLYPKTIKIESDYWKIYSSPSIYTREVSYTSIETAINKLSWNACFFSNKKETTSLNAFKLTSISIQYQNLNCELSVTQMI